MGLTHNISRGISSSLMKLTKRTCVAAQRHNHRFGRFGYNFHMFMGCGKPGIELGCGYGSLTATTSAHHGKSYEAASYSCISGCLCRIGNYLDLLFGARCLVLTRLGILSAKNGDFWSPTSCLPSFLTRAPNRQSGLGTLIASQLCRRTGTCAQNFVLSRCGRPALQMH